MDAIYKKNCDTSKPCNLTPAQKPTREQAQEAVKTLIMWAGDNPEREGLLDTPKRVVKAFEELYEGYAQNPEEHLVRVFEEVSGYNDMVMVRSIPFHSHCEHHMLPFFGRAHIAYYPNEGVIGLSKLARVVDVFAKRLQTQEALTSQIAHAIIEGINPHGLAIVLEAEHMCMSMRGIAKHGASTLTTHFSGKFADDLAEQKRFLQFVNTAD